MLSLRRCILAHTELGWTGLHVCYAVSVRAPPWCSWLVPLLVCWPSQALNSSSRLKRSFRASVMTYDVEESMNSAYRSSCAFTDSSTRAWIVIVFGCLGGALMIAMLSLCSSFTVLSYILSYKSVAAPRSSRPKHGLRFLSSLRRECPPKPEGTGPRVCGAV